MSRWRGTRGDGTGDGLVVFANYDKLAESDWRTFFPAVFSAAAAAVQWPDFPGLEDEG